VAGHSDVAWFVSFYTGAIANGWSKSLTDNVRCVRGAIINTCPANAVKIDGTSSYFTTIQAAYNTATTGQSVLIQALDFNENLSLSRNIAVSLQGGYDCNFASILGIPTIHGSIAIGGGSVTASNLIIQ
jgi:hypothetical protein